MNEPIESEGEGESFGESEDSRIHEQDIQQSKYESEDEGFGQCLSTGSEGKDFSDNEEDTSEFLETAPGMFVIAERPFYDSLPDDGPSNTPPPAESDRDHGPFDPNPEDEDTEGFFSDVSDIDQDPRHDQYNTIHAREGDDGRLPPWPSSVAQELKDALVCAEAPPDVLCACSAPSTITCHDCHKNLCQECDGLLHFSDAAGSHLRYQYQDECKKPWLGLCGCGIAHGRAHQYHLSSGQCACPSEECKPVSIFVDVFSLYFTKTTVLTLCPEIAVATQFISAGLFPATARDPGLGFPLWFMSFCHSFQIAGKMTTHTLLDAILHFQRSFVELDFVDLQKKDHVRKCLLSALQLYRDLNAEIRDESLSVLGSPKCPACSSGTAISQSVDVQFKVKNLKPKKSKFAEQRIQEARDDPARGVVFGPRSMISQFIDDFRAEASQSVDVPCTNVLSAVETANASHGDKKLDTTGIMTAVCRHDVISQIVQLEHGERYGYALLTLLLVCQLWPETLPLFTVFAWLYDIACRFRPYVQRQYDLLPSSSPMKAPLKRLLEMPHAIGTGHVIGHTLWCQLYLSARAVLGLGTTCGEGNERVQSLLVSCVCQLKYATPLNFRRELRHIVDFLNIEKIWNFWAALSRRHKVALESMHAAHQKLLQLFSELAASGLLTPVSASDVRYDEVRLLGKVCDRCRPLINTLLCPLVSTPSNVTAIGRDTKQRGDAEKQLHEQGLVLAEIVTPLRIRTTRPDDPLHAFAQLWDVAAARAIFIKEQKHLVPSHVSYQKLRDKIKSCERNMRSRITSLLTLLNQHPDSGLLSWNRVVQVDSVWWAAALSGEFLSDVARLNRFDDSSAEGKVSRDDSMLQLRMNIRLLARKMLRELCLLRASSEELMINRAEKARADHFFQTGLQLVSAKLSSLPEPVSRLDHGRRALFRRSRAQWQARIDICYLSTDSKRRPRHRGPKRVSNRRRTKQRTDPERADSGAESLGSPGALAIFLNSCTLVRATGPDWILSESDLQTALELKQDGHPDPLEEAGSLDNMNLMVTSVRFYAGWPQQ